MNYLSAVVCLSVAALVAAGNFLFSLSFKLFEEEKKIGISIFLDHGWSNRVCCVVLCVDDESSGGGMRKKKRPTANNSQVSKLNSQWLRNQKLLLCKNTFNKTTQVIDFWY